MDESTQGTPNKSNNSFDSFVFRTPDSGNPRNVEWSPAWVRQKKRSLEILLHNPYLEHRCIETIMELYTERHPGTRTLLRWAFLEACTIGILGVVGLMLHNGQNVHREEGDTITPLVAAAASDDYSTVRELLSYGADVNRCEKDEDIPLLAALKRGLVIGAEGDPNQLDGEGVSNVDIITLLVEFGADIHYCGIDGFTPLSLAVSAQRRDVVRYLLAKGARVDSQDTRMLRTPLMHAVLAQDLEIVYLLYKANADVHAVDVIGYTPLMLAIVSRNEAMVTLLLSLGSNVNWASFHDYRTPLILATEVGDPDIVVRVLVGGADQYYTHPNLERGTTAYTIALNMGFENIANMILLSVEETYKIRSGMGL